MGKEGIVFVDGLGAWTIVIPTLYYSSRDSLANNCKYKKECQKICQSQISVTSSERPNSVPRNLLELSKINFLFFLQKYE